MINAERDYFVFLINKNLCKSLSFFPETDDHRSMIKMKFDFSKNIHECIFQDVKIFLENISQIKYSYNISFDSESITINIKAFDTTEDDIAYLHKRFKKMNNIAFVDESATINIEAFNIARGEFRQSLANNLNVPMNRLFSTDNLPEQTAAVRLDENRYNTLMEKLTTFADNDNAENEIEKYNKIMEILLKNFVLKNLCTKLIYHNESCDDRHLQIEIEQDKNIEVRYIIDALNSYENCHCGIYNIYVGSEIKSLICINLYNLMDFSWYYHILKKCKTAATFIHWPFELPGNVLNYIKNNFDIDTNYYYNAENVNNEIAMTSTPTVRINNLQEAYEGTLGNIIPRNIVGFRPGYMQPISFNTVIGLNTKNQNENHWITNNSVENYHTVTPNKLKSYCDDTIIVRKKYKEAIKKLNEHLNNNEHTPELKAKAKRLIEKYEKVIKKMKDIVNIIGSDDFVDDIEIKDLTPSNYKLIKKSVKKCSRCGTKLENENKDYLTIYGNIAFGDNMRITRDNFDESGQLSKPSCFCKKCVESFTDKILNYFYENDLID